MVVMSLPSTVSDFKGEISHVALAGNEKLIFVKPSTWKGEWGNIKAKLQSLAPSLTKITTLSSVKSGEVYIVKIKNSFKRTYIIRRPTPETFLIYLIDKGIQCEIQFGEIYEFPLELLEFGVFNCVCPVVAPSTEELSLYKSLVGCKCKCTVEVVSKSMVVMGFIRGRLLIEVDGYYKTLYDIILEKKADRPESSGAISPMLHLKLDKHPGHIQTGQVDDSSSSSNESTFPHQFIKNVELRTNTGIRSLFPERSDFLTPRKEKCVVNPCANFFTDYDRPKIGTLFNQTAFRQYVPEVLPMRIAVRFDKKDRMINTFWVVHKNIFSATEKALRDVASKLSRFPPIDYQGDDFYLRQTPCIARARADTAYKSLFRAVPAQYDPRTRRMSIFLVDFGWFKWVLASDVLDISMMDNSDPIRNLPVAMIHCREDTTSILHAKDLVKGADCEIIIKGNAHQNVYTVDLLGPPFMMDGIDGASNEQPFTGNETMINNMRADEMISSCKKLVTETCQRQLMASMMMKTLSIASRELAQQHQNFWPTFCPTAFPVAMPIMMPVFFPVMMPMSIQDANAQGTRDVVPVRPRNMVPKPQNMAMKPQRMMVKPQNIMANDVEGASFSNNPRAQSGSRGINNKRPPKTDFMQKTGIRSQSLKPESEMARDEAGIVNGFGIIPNEKKQTPQNSREEENNDLSWDLPPKYAKQRRTFQKSNDDNAQKGQPNDWEKAVEADRAAHNQQDNNSSGSGCG